MDNLTVISQVKSQIENKQMKESGCVLDKLASMTIYFYKTNEMNGSSYVKKIGKSSIIKYAKKDK